jgi:hypothetical protein
LHALDPGSHHDRALTIVHTLPQLHAGALKIAAKEQHGLEAIIAKKDLQIEVGRYLRLWDSRSQPVILCFADITCLPASETLKLCPVVLRRQVLSHALSSKTVELEDVQEDFEVGDLCPRMTSGLGQYIHVYTAMA